jgi:hypothetical protein
MQQYVKPYLVITSHKLRHGMQNTIASELLWCRIFLEYLVDLHLLLSRQLFCLHLLPCFSGDSMVILWYAFFFATFLVYVIMATYVNTACRISASKESAPLPALQVFFVSIRL